MKKILNITFILTLLFIFLSTFAYADRNTSTIKSVSSNQYLKTGDWKIYRIDFIATSAGGSFAVYDASTAVAAKDTNIKVEGAEATALNGKTFDFTGKPIEGSTGLYLSVNAATLIVEYE